VVIPPLSPENKKILEDAGKRAIEVPAPPAGAATALTGVKGLEEPGKRISAERRDAAKLAALKKLAQQEVAKDPAGNIYTVNRVNTPVPFTDNGVFGEDQVKFNQADLDAAEYFVRKNGKEVKASALEATHARIKGKVYEMRGDIIAVLEPALGGKQRIIKDEKTFYDYYHEGWRFFNEVVVDASGRRESMPVMLEQFLGHYAGYR
jgi:hypothetical protein